ncbi:neutral/alkaline non-lysosomal ceramidase N-terminal domain-containing protein [Gordonia caeni]|uniref:Neutral ceramidase n=1 Tax=Gordonia caeni TaxID=1007097 RepID=A0ABP7PSD4_9ACTN
MNDEWRLGRGIADVTGEPWGVGMMGYGMPQQRTRGIRSRQFARAFVFDDGDRRLAFVVADIGMFFQAGVAAVYEGLAARFGDIYGPGNVVLTATHTHCGPGGHGHDVLYNITTAGHHRRTFTRLVDGVVEAIARADADLAPTTATLTRGQLTTASVNRARSAFDRDAPEDRAIFPGAIDPSTLLLRFERDGTLVGAINWFAVHNTSMPNTNRLISADNKGWAAYTWEQTGADPQGVDPELVTAFAQTNSGDQSPNLDLLPGKGPTDDEVLNTAIIGERQLAAARALAQEPGTELALGIDVRYRYLRVPGRSTPSGRTGRAILGASFAAGKMTDGPGSPLFREGKRNPFPQLISGVLYRLRPSLARAQAPKDLFLPIGPMKWAQETYLLQLVRWGQLHLICLPFECTIVAGLRMRRAVAAELGVDPDLVVLQGYANGYGHYVTTPEEYDEQLYEGGATVFGRHELPAIQAAVVELATALREGGTVDPGTPPRPHRLSLNSPVGSPRFARSQRVRLRHTDTSVRAGETVTATFDTDHPNTVIRPTYLRVERFAGDDWTVVADDASTTTAISWRRNLRLRFTAETTWIADEPGTYRITYIGANEATTPPIIVH